MIICTRNIKGFSERKIPMTKPKEIIMKKHEDVYRSFIRDMKETIEILPALLIEQQVKMMHIICFQISLSQIVLEFLSQQPLMLR